MSVPQADIDHILRMEGNIDYARMKIATEFSKGKSVEEIAAFLQSSFHGGNGVVTENGRYSAGTPTTASTLPMGTRQDT